MTNEQHQQLYTKIYWVFTTFMLLSAMPLGIVLILVKLFERRRKGKAKKVFRPVPGAPAGAQTIHPGTSSPIRESLDSASRDMRRRAGIGTVLVVFCCGLLIFCLHNGIALWLSGWSLFCSFYYLFSGLHTLFSVSRFRNYIDIMEKKPILSVAELARQAGLPEKTIRQDWMNVEFMDLLPGIFWDRKQNILFCF